MKTLKTTKGKQSLTKWRVLQLNFLHELHMLLFGFSSFDCFFYFFIVSLIGAWTRMPNPYFVFECGWKWWFIENRTYIYLVPSSVLLKSDCHGWYKNIFRHCMDGYMKIYIYICSSWYQTWKISCWVNDLKWSEIIVRFLTLHAERYEPNEKNTMTQRMNVT